MAGKTQYIPMRVVAERYNVSLAAVQKWCRLKRIPCVKTPGGQYKIPRSEFEALWAASKVTTSVDAHGRARTLTDGVGAVNCGTGDVK